MGNDLMISIGEISEGVGFIKKAAPVIAIPIASYPTKILRQNFSILDFSTTIKLLGLEPLHWRESLYKLLKELK